VGLPDRVLRLTAARLEEVGQKGTECAVPHLIARQLQYARLPLKVEQNQAENPTMSIKHAAKQNCTTNAAAVTALGAAGLGLSLAGSASASTMPGADIPQSQNTPPNQRFVLGDEEMADVSLATFHLFDKENVGSDLQVAVVVRRGCGGCRGCRAWRGCRCGGCGGCGGCCARWGRCRWC
jgi:hypothetical protein